MKEQSFQLSQKKTIIILSIIILLGTALRLYRINYQSLWYDELHSIIPTDPQNSIQSIIEYCKTDQPPAFFIFIHYVFKLFGYNEVVGRIATSLIGVVAIPLFYFLGKELQGKTTGIFAALLVAVNYFHIYYSQELRFYSMLFLFSGLSYYFFIRAFKNAQIIDFICYIICTVALLYTHYYGLVIYAVQALTFILLIIFYKKELKFIVGGCVSGVVILIAFIPWFQIIINDLGISSFWIKEPTPFFIADYFYNYFGKDAFSAIAFTFLSILFFKSITGRRKNDFEERPLYFILIIWLVLSYLIPYIKSISSTPVLHIRYTIISLPAWILIFALGWDKIKQLKWKFFFAGVITLSAIVNLIFIRKHYIKIQKQQFREVVGLVNTKNTEDYPIVTALFWHFNFYLHDSLNKAVHPSSLDFSSVEKFWLLHVEFFTPEEKSELLKSFEEDFEVSEEYKFYKAEAILMVRERK